MFNLPLLPKNKVEMYPILKNKKFRLQVQKEEIIVIRYIY